jgi:DNA-binding NtrC family response regulator
MMHRTLPSPGEVEPALLPPHAASRCVLIVEDEKRLRDMLHAAVTEMGLQSTAAASAEAALKLAAHDFFAVAMVDLNLPGMDGLEFCEQLARIKPHIQVIIVTGFGDLEAAQKAIRLQVVDFLTKPCRMDDLESALNRARQRWLDRWTNGDRPAETQADFEEAEPAASPSTAATDPAEQHSIDEMERHMIMAALSRHSGNRQAAATELGISVRKLYYRIQQYQRLGILKPSG